MQGTSQLPPEVLKALLRRERLALIGRLSEGLSHNISGAVQMLRLPLDLMELKLPRATLEENLAKLEAVNQGVDRLSQELAMFSVKSSRILSLEPERLSMCSVVREVLDFWRAHMYFKHSVELETDLPANQGVVMAAAADLALALDQLIANAVESLESSGCKGLSVKSTITDGRQVIAISDSGPGPEMDGIFVPFTGDKGEGHDGLGLCLAVEAVKPYGGEVHQDLNCKSCFCISMPLLAE